MPEPDVCVVRGAPRWGYAAVLTLRDDAATEPLAARAAVRVADLLP